MRILPPDPTQVLVIVGDLYRTIREMVGGGFAGRLAPDGRAAIGFIATDGCEALLVEDINRAAHHTLSAGS